MKWIIDKNRPICPQICEQICVAISKGELEPKSKIYSVRELALEIGVNPNTVQKSYDELEKKGVLNSIRGSGWYVSEDISIAKEVVSKIYTNAVSLYNLQKDFSTAYKHFTNAGNKVSINKLSNKSSVSDINYGEFMYQFAYGIASDSWKIANNLITLLYN